MKKGTKNEEVLLRKGIIHLILVNSYLVFIYAIIAGLIFDLFVPIKIFNYPFYQNIGILMIILGTFLVYWAQHSSNTAKKVYKDNVSVDAFMHGAYRYIRNPTHLGLLIMTLGLSFLINSLFSVIFLIISYIIIKIVFQKKEQNILIKKYGQIYIDYKNKVKNWL